MSPEQWAVIAIALSPLVWLLFEIAFAATEDTSGYVVEPLDDEWAVLWAVVEGER